MRMMPTQDGSGYGPFGAPRRQGPTVASRKGAAAIVIRSIGTDYHRNPIPACRPSTRASVRSPPPRSPCPTPSSCSASWTARRPPVRMRLTLTPRNLGTRQSGNVVAEVPGSDPDAGVIIVGGHLDSWDLGTGAIDNAAGVAITTAAAHRIMQAGRPRRTIRVVLFGAEEVGGGGGPTHFRLNHPAGNVVLGRRIRFRRGPGLAGAVQLRRGQCGAGRPDRGLARAARHRPLRGMPPMPART